MLKHETVSEEPYVEQNYFSKVETKKKKKKEILKTEKLLLAKLYTTLKNELRMDQRTKSIKLLEKT